MRALLINPEELIELGLVLVPDATHYSAAGEPSKSWQSLAGFIVAALDDLATTHPTEGGRPVDATLAIPCSDTLAVRSVEAGPHEIRVHFEWCGIEREIVYFLRDFWQGMVPGNVRCKRCHRLGPTHDAIGRICAPPCPCARTKSHVVGHRGCL